MSTEQIMKREMTAEEIQESTQRRAIAMQEIRNQIIRSIKDLEWISFGGKPYPDADKLCKFIMNLDVGYKIFDGPKIIAELNDSNNNKYIIFQARCRAWIGKESDPFVVIEEVGHAVSSDGFFEHQEFGERLKNIMEKTATNAFGRAMRTLLGLRGLTWKELEKLGVKPVAEVKFKTKKKKKSENNENQNKLELTDKQNDISMYWKNK